MANAAGCIVPVTAGQSLHVAMYIYPQEGMVVVETRGSWLLGHFSILEHNETALEPYARCGPH